MGKISLAREYNVDPGGFLVDPDHWTSNFAEDSASACGIPAGLTDRHWRVINFIRLSYELEGRCPLIYQTCLSQKLTLAGLKKLFPTGYLRGACKLAGLSWRETFLNKPWADYSDWNEQRLAEEMSWAQQKVVAYLREYHRTHKTIPTVYDTCEANHLEIDELERLFPDGYHRGAVRLAGLRYRT